MPEKTILLVEDNENDVFLTRRALARSHTPHKLVVAHDGVEALDYLSGKDPLKEAGQPVVVLLDLKLPRIDGLQVLKAIRSAEDTRDLPVMVFTSSSEEVDISAACRLGATSYTVKPVDSQQYIETILKLVFNCLK
jgi:two-component system, response regulator